MAWNNFNRVRPLNEVNQPLWKAEGGPQGFDIDWEWIIPGTPISMKVLVVPGSATVVATIEIGLGELNLFSMDDQDNKYTLKGGPQGFNIQLLGPNNKPLLGITSVEHSCTSGRTFALMHWTFKDIEYTLIYGHPVCERVLAERYLKVKQLYHSVAKLKA